MSSPIQNIASTGSSLPAIAITTDLKRLTLHNLLSVYPIVTAIVKNLSFRQLISLAQTDKGCFAFLRGGDWDVDVRRWDNIRSNCSEVCEFSDYHDYFDPIKATKACNDCKYGVCDYCVGPAQYLGDRRRILCSTCVEKRLDHPKYRGKTEFYDCLCTDGQDPWLCRFCWKVKYFARWHGPADICVDCGTKVEDVQKEVSVCGWCQGKTS